MVRRFGSRVTLVQRADQLLPAEDPGISAAVAQGLAPYRIEVLTGTTCVAADAAGIRIGSLGGLRGGPMFTHTP